MNVAYIYMLLMLSVGSLYSADKNIQQLSDIKTCSYTIVHEGIAAVHTDIYSKLLGISRTLQEQVNDFGKPTPLANKPHCPVNRNIESLQYIVNFISADNSDTYLRTLSLIELVHLYQEADFWAVDTHILDTIRNGIISQLRNKNVLSQLLSSKENLAHFINTCNTVTLDTLTQALHSYTSDLLWYTAQILISHTEWIGSVAVHTDGTLFSGSDDNTIRVWKSDAQGVYHCTQTLTGHTNSIISLAVHTDGTVFSCSSDCTIRVWKSNAQGIYNCVQTLTDHTSWVNTVTVYTDDTLFSGSNDHTIRIWKSNAQGIYHCVQTLTGCTSWISSVAIHTDGTLFSGSGYGTIRVWKADAQSIYHCVQTLTGHSDWIRRVVVHKDGTVFSASNDCTIRVWKKDVQGTYYGVKTLIGHTNSLYSVAVNIDGTLFSGSDDCTIRVWKPDAQRTYHCVQTLADHSSKVSSVAVHPDGTLFSGSDNATIRVWKPLEEHLSLEQHLLLQWLYTMYKLNNNMQINTLSAHMIEIYDTLPQSIKDHMFSPGSLSEKKQE